MKKTFLFIALVVLLGAWQILPGGASSHREAPLISQDPMADNTDLYAFRSPDRPDTVTIIANYIPLESPAGGPNFPAFDDTVLYEIHVDNDGDAKEDLTYQFRFQTETRNPDTFLYNTGPIASLDDPNWNRRQTYTVRLIRQGRGRSEKAEVLGASLTTPPDNIGPRSTPNYVALADAAVHTLRDGIKVFAGQRDDPFFVDLGSVFDLAGLRPFNAFHAIPLPPEPGRDAVARYNTHSIAIQVPITQLVQSPRTTIGVYASASRQQVRILRKDGMSNDEGPFVQVSRLENALYGTPPQGHAGGALMPIAETGRADLVAILLTGVPGLNFTGPRKADLLRLNTAIAPSAAVGMGNRLGVLAGDFAGFPNGRRLEDDIVDIDLRAFAEGYGPILHAALGLPDKSPNDLLGDGVDANDKPFLGRFPYVATPHQGYEVP